MDYCPATLINKLVIALAILFLSLQLAGAEPLSGSIPARGAISAELRARVKLTAASAVKRVVEKFPGAVTEVALEVEEGFLVYEVESNGADGFRHEFLVDAGNGAFLAHKTMGPVRAAGRKSE